MRLGSVDTRPPILDSRSRSKMVALDLNSFGLLFLGCPVVEHAIRDISKDADSNTEGQDTRGSPPSPVVHRSIIRAEDF